MESKENASHMGGKELNNFYIIVYIRSAVSGLRDASPLENGSWFCQYFIVHVVISFLALRCSQVTNPPRPPGRDCQKFAGHGRLERKHSAYG